MSSSSSSLKESVELPSLHAFPIRFPSAVFVVKLGAQLVVGRSSATVPLRAHSEFGKSPTVPGISSPILPAATADQVRAVPTSGASSCISSTYTTISSRASVPNFSTKKL
jgi:hypothetical protein